MELDVQPVAVLLELEVGRQVDAVAKIPPVEVRLQPLDRRGAFREREKSPSELASRFEHVVPAVVENDEREPYLAKYCWRMYRSRYFKILITICCSVSDVGILPPQQFIIPIHSHTEVNFLNIIGNHLNKRNHSVTYISQDKYVAKTAQRQLEHEDLEPDYIDHRPISGFDALCEKYGIDSPRDLVFPQMVYDRSYDAPSYRPYWLSGTGTLPYEEYLNLLHRTLDFLDRLYEDGNGGIPLQNQGGEVLRRALQRVADYHGYPSVRTSFSPVPGHVLFRSTEKMHFPALKAATYDEMTHEQREAAQEFRASVTENQQQVMGSTGQSESFYQNLRRKARRIQEHRDDLAPIISGWVRRRVAKPVFGTVAKHLYLDEAQSREFIESKEYVFYPLQYFGESRVTMRAPEFYNQLWVIQYLSRSLPPGYELVVKDHPRQLGALPLSQTYKLRRYAAAVAPTLSAREVLTESDAVVTLNNTVGFEALMYGKPVVTLGDAFYSGSGYTRDVTNLNSLSAELNLAVHSGGLSDEAVLEFVNIILYSSYEGEWGNTSRENIKTFVKSMDESLSDKEH